MKNEEPMEMVPSITNLNADPNYKIGEPQTNAMCEGVNDLANNGDQNTFRYN